MDHRCITFERREAVGLLTLNRPERANAIDRTMLAELNATCDAVEADETIRALVVTGAGGAFSSGFDLKEQAAAPPVGVAQWRDVLRDDFDTVMRFWHLSKPTVAAVRGPALAGGCELALACDVTVAAEDARFGEPELRFGAGIVVMLMPWLTGPKHAKEILLSGEDEIGAQGAPTRSASSTASCRWATRSRPRSRSPAAWPPSSRHFSSAPKPRSTACTA